MFCKNCGKESDGGVKRKGVDMKKKLVVAAAALLMAAVPCFAEKSPMRVTGFFEGIRTYKEQDGYAIVLERKLHYWLYDTYTYHNGNGFEVCNQVIPRWIESMGYVIDFDNMHITNPNTVLANSVKALMKQRGCDVSVTLITRESGYPTDRDYFVINNYDKSKDSYSTTVYYLRK